MKSNPMFEELMKEQSLSAQDIKNIVKDTVSSFKPEPKEDQVKMGLGPGDFLFQIRTQN